MNAVRYVCMYDCTRKHRHTCTSLMEGTKPVSLTGKTGELRNGCFIHLLVEKLEQIRCTYFGHKAFHVCWTFIAWTIFLVTWDVISHCGLVVPTLDRVRAEIGVLDLIVPNQTLAFHPFFPRQSLTSLHLSRNATSYSSSLELSDTSAACAADFCLLTLIGVHPGLPSVVYFTPDAVLLTSNSKSSAASRWSSVAPSESEVLVPAGGCMYSFPEKSHNLQGQSSQSHRS